MPASRNRTPDEFGQRQSRDELATRRSTSSLSDVKTGIVAKRMRVGEIVSGRSRNVSLPTGGTLKNADSHSDGLNGDEARSARF